MSAGRDPNAGFFGSFRWLVSSTMEAARVAIRGNRDCSRLPVVMTAWRRSPQFMVPSVPTCGRSSGSNLIVTDRGNDVR